MSPTPLFLDRGAVLAVPDAGAVTPPTQPPGGAVDYPASYYTGPLGVNNILPLSQGCFLVDYPGGGGVEWTVPYLGGPTATARILSREAAMGRLYDCVHTSYWGGGSVNLPGGGSLYGVFGNELDQNREQWIHNHGSIPLISWSPYYTIPQVNAGDSDAVHAYMANYFKQLPFRIMLRMWWEFDNDAGFPWCVGHSANIGAPFIAAWRRIVNLFKANGCNNVGFWWCPLEAGDRAGAVASYPGDAYVDWCGSDAYNNCYFGENSCWGTSPNGPGWRTFDDIAAYTLTPNYHDRYGAIKPFAYGEVGCVWDPNPLYQNLKGDWFRAVPNTLKTKLPHCVAWSYFDADVSGLEEARNNWEIDYTTATPDIMAGYVQMSHDPWFNTGDDGKNRVKVAVTFKKDVRGTGGVVGGAYPYQTAVIGLAPVAYWPLQNGSGVAKTGLDLTMQNLPGSAPAMVTGSPGSTSFVAQTQQGASHAHIAALNFAGVAPFTITFWAKPTALVNSRSFSIIEQRTQAEGGWSVAQGWGLGANLTFCRDFGATEIEAEVSGMFAAGVASFIAIVYNGTQWEVFRDAVSKRIVPDAGSMTISAGEFYIGRNLYNDTCFDGHIAEVAIFNYALGQANLNTLYAAR